MPSFNVCSEVDQPNIHNTIDQCKRLIQNRFDFKQVPANFELKENIITLSALEEFQLEQMYEILKTQCAKNNIHQKHLEPEEKIQANGKQKKMIINLIQGLSTEKAKEINKFIKSTKIKVQSVIEGDQLRVSGKKRDDLQQIIQSLKQEYAEFPLQFENFRD